MTGVLSSIDDVITQYSGGNHTIGFTSQATGTVGETEVSGPAGWIAEFSVGGGEYSSTPPDWLVGFPMSGEGDITDVPYTVKPAPRSNASDFSATPRGEEGNPWNLAGNPANGNLQGAADWETANCYIVNNPGWYSLPLAYGNAIKDGASNPHSYMANGTATSTFLKNFIRHDGQAINSPYIYNNSFASPIDDATLVWQDVPGMVTQIELDAAKENLLFYIDEDNIAQGNAMVAVRDAAGAIMWSWHIWVTKSSIVDASNPAAATKATTTHASYGPQVNRILEYALGFVEGYTSSYAARKVIVRIRQTGIDYPAAKTFTIYSDAEEGPATGDASNYYQFGRKDAMISSGGGTTSTNPVVEWGVRKDGELYNKVNTTDPNEPASRLRNSQPVASSNVGSITKAIVNPHIAYPKTTNPRDWNAGTEAEGHTKRAVNNLWSIENTAMSVNGNTVVKTVYDPSPAGFKMPPSNAWTGFTQNGNNTGTNTQFNVSQPVSNNSYIKGWRFYLDGWQATTGNTSFYAATGYRNDAGQLNSLNNGYYWSAIPGNVPVLPQFQRQSGVRQCCQEQQFLRAPHAG